MHPTCSGARSAKAIATTKGGAAPSRSAQSGWRCDHPAEQRCLKAILMDWVVSALHGLCADPFADVAVCTPVEGLATSVRREHARASRPDEAVGTSFSPIACATAAAHSPPRTARELVCKTTKADEHAVSTLARALEPQHERQPASGGRYSVGGHCVRALHGRKHRLNGHPVRPLDTQEDGRVTANESVRLKPDAWSAS